MLDLSQFNTIEEFKIYVNSLSDSDIQKWKTKDWLNLYGRLDSVIEQDENLFEQTTNYVCKQYPDSVLSEDSDCVKIYFSKFIGSKELVKLHKNFRFEEESLQQMKLIARKIGKKLAMQNIDLASDNIYNDKLDETRTETAQKTDKIIFYQTNYVGQISYQDAESLICVLPDEYMTSSYGVQKSYLGNKSSIELTNDHHNDVSLQTAIHEIVHAYFQVTLGQQEYFMRQGILPSDKFPEDFYKLLIANNSYYIDDESGSVNRLIKKGELSVRDAQIAYRCQPLEKMADYMGIVAERVFRKETKQYSERIAQDVVAMIDDIVPISAKYSSKNGHILLKYRCADIDKSCGDIRYLKNRYFDFLDQKTFDKFLVFSDHGQVCIVPPVDYNSRQCIAKARDYKEEFEYLREKSKSANENYREKTLCEPCLLRSKQQNSK